VIVLGIDPGSRKLGWGIVNVAGRNLSANAWGVIRVDPAAPFPERLVAIHARLNEVIAEHHPQKAAIEAVFQAGSLKNVSSVLKLGEARGVALLALAQAGLEIHEYSPAEVKKFIVGHGRAEKGQIQAMVKAFLGLDRSPAEDAADALAVATCLGFRLLNPLQWRTP
jgi:crossover junction endodeoxyribonuclease RuvC